MLFRHIYRIFLQWRAHKADHINILASFISLIWFLCRSALLVNLVPCKTIFLQVSVASTSILTKLYRANARQRLGLGSPITKPRCPSSANASKTKAGGHYFLYFLIFHTNHILLSGYKAKTYKDRTCPSLNFQRALVFIVLTMEILKKWARNCTATKHAVKRQSVLIKCTKE